MLKDEFMSPEVLLANALQFVQDNKVVGVTVLIGCMGDKGQTLPINASSAMPYETLLMLKESLSAEISNKFIEFQKQNQLTED